MSQQNPFDLSNLMGQFDPAALTKQLQGMMSNYKIPSLDTNALVQAQTKNMQALAAANRAAIEGTQTMLKRQLEMVQQAVSEASEAAKQLASSGSPQAAAAQQTKLIEDAFTKALSNATEISELLKKTQEDASQVVTTRIGESLTEVRETIEKMK